MTVVRRIASPVVRPLVRAINAAYGISAFTPARLFTTGVNGAWYDPSDTTTLFRDAAGTLPVTAVEQPVGLMLDKSKGLVLGPELLSQPINFTTGWVSEGGTVVDSNTFSTAATGGISLVLSSPQGKYYEVKISAQSNCVVYFGTSSETRVAVGANGTYRVRWPTADTSAKLYLRNTAAGTTDVTELSLREIPGNHAFNSSGNSANFPVLSARYNLLTKTEQFDDAVWTKQQFNPFGSGSVANTTATTDPLGGNTADFLQENSANTFHYFIYNVGSSYVANTSHKISVCAKASGRNWIYLDALDSISCYFNLSTGTVGTAANGGSGSIESLGNGWYRCTLSFTTPASLTNTNFRLFTSANGTSVSYQGDGTSGIYIWGADLRVANDALNQPAYQRVNTATDYDTVGFKPYLRFNGTNQWLQTNSIDFTYGDKMFVSAGVRKLSDAAAGMVVELSTSVATNAGSFFLLAPGGAASTYAMNSRGSSLTAQLNATGYVSPITNVVSGIGNISGDQAILQVNGTQVASSTADQGTGNYGNYPLYIGARAGSSLWFNGRLYSLIVSGKLANAVEITETEKYVNGKTAAIDWRDVTDSSSFRWNSATASPDAS